jgi:glycosyltransferase involved in cell wall biosynthesis
MLAFAAATRKNMRVEEVRVRVGVVIPAFNEEGSIAGAVRACRALESIVVQASRLHPCRQDACTTSQDRELRVVVCDNASTDRTAELARDAGAEVVRESQRGYGAACLAAIAHLGGWPDVLLFCDADAGSPPEELRRVLAPLYEGAADFVIGARLDVEAGAMTLPQRAGNRLATFLIRALWGHRFADLGPTRAIRRQTLERLALADRTWGWTIEMQIQAVRHGVRMLEVPVGWRKRRAGASKISGTVLGVIRAGSKILWTVARLYFRVKKQTAHVPPMAAASRTTA